MKKTTYKSAGKFFNKVCYLNPLNFKKTGNPLVLSTKSYENGDKSEFKDIILRAKLQNHYVR